MTSEMPQHFKRTPESQSAATTEGEAMKCECCQSDDAKPRLCVDGEVADICDECLDEMQKGEWLIAPGAPVA